MRKLLLQKQKSEDQIESNKMLCLVDTILWSRDVDNYKNTVVQFEVSKYRRILKISWTTNNTNEEVLRRIGTGRKIVRQLKTRKLQYIYIYIYI